MPYNLLGKSQNGIEEPTLRNNKNYVPLAQVVETLGGNIHWENDSKTAVATIGQWTARVQPDSTHVDVSGTAVNLSAAPVLEDGTMYVPWDFFRDAYGYKASFDNDTLSLSL
jgi:hypothetical protein